jgi:DNA uptake protein ComE-like DNA-binding protein
LKVNAAAAEEIAQVLHLDTTAAEGIVSHRVRNGKFADFDALIAVPGVLVEALKMRRGAIVF